MVVAVCRTLWPNVHFLHKRKYTTQTALALIGPFDRSALPPTYFCFISHDCGVNMDGVAGTTAKCLKICAQDWFINAAPNVKRWDRVRKEQACIHQQRKKEA